LAAGAGALATGLGLAESVAAQELAVQDQLMAGKLNGYVNVLFFKGDGANSSVVGLISAFVMGYRGCYLCTLCALWCCHATILIDKLVACCHANMFNFSESIKPKSLHPGNTSIAQLDTMCCIGRAYVELATPRLFLQM